MNKPILTAIFAFLTSFTIAQTTPAPVPTAQPYGKIDKSDLELTSCDFEKDANAEVLIDKGSVYFDNDYNLNLEVHVRIKIFNEKANDVANIKIRFRPGNQYELISGLQAETINLNNGAIEITKVDKKQIFTQKLNKAYSELNFSFPNVKPGSVIEYKYTKTTWSFSNFPQWFFQGKLPVRYSEFNATIPYFLIYKTLVMVHQPFLKNTDQVKSMVNIPSLNWEPYMSSFRDNNERILHQLQNISLPTYYRTISDTWEKVGKEFINSEDFGSQINRSLAGEDEIITKAKGLKTDREKIAFLFNTVKTKMKWNDFDFELTDDGTAEAWKKSTGNSTEINLILNHLLQKSGIKSYPMLVSTKENGKINPAFPNTYLFDRTVAYVPIDSANYYILDATDKYNIFNETPSELLNGFGLYIDKRNEKADIVFIQKTKPVRGVSLINAEIKPDGKMTGTVQINSFSYDRISAVSKYKIDGEEKYIKYLRGNDNNLKVSDLKFENMDNDTLALTQNFNFNLDLQSGDDGYIYFKPNYFAKEFENDFLSEHRYTDIDFGYLGNYALNGTYKIPVGYKVDAMPKSISMALPDNGIIFKRLVAEQDGSILVRYTLTYKKNLFFKEDYGDFHEFFKKMTELFNEQVVLKKI